MKYRLRFIVEKCILGSYDVLRYQLGTFINNSGSYLVTDTFNKLVFIRNIQVYQSFPIPLILKGNEEYEMVNFDF